MAFRRLFKISLLVVLVVFFFFVGQYSAADAPALATASYTVVVFLMAAAALFVVWQSNLKTSKMQAKINTQIGGRAIQDVNKISSGGDLTMRDKVLQVFNSCVQVFNSRVFNSRRKSQHHENIEAYPSNKPSPAPRSTPATTLFRSTPPFPPPPPFHDLPPLSPPFPHPPPFNNPSPTPAPSILRSCLPLRPRFYDPPAAIGVANEIMTIYRSLPPRPTIDEVEAAMAILRTIDTEEQLNIEVISNRKKPSGVPEEDFFVLQEVKKNRVLLQSHKQRKEPLFLVDLDKRFKVFDELIQRASSSSKMVSVDSQKMKKQEDLDDPVAKNERKDSVSDESLIGRNKDEKDESGFSKGLLHSSSKKDAVSTGDVAEKLSLIKVTSLMETSAENRAGVLDHQGKLMDQFEGLPVSLGNLSNITELNWSKNRIMALPSTIGGLKFLIKLDIHSNQLVNLPESFGELSNLADLDLHGNRLRSLPSSFGNLTSLVNLDLSSNQLCLLPETIGNLTSMKTMNVGTNELKELPYTVGLCSSLIELRVDFNQLKALPEATGKLECLETLTLHYNRVRSLPTTMRSLSNLKELNVSHNELEYVPENLCLATNLVKLNVGSNFANLRSLPKSIGNLEMLEELDISNNQIKELPDSFKFLSKLKVFYADETLLEVPPREIVKMGAQAVVKYMADLAVKKVVAFQQSNKKGF